MTEMAFKGSRSRLHDEFVAFAEELADAVRPIALEHFRGAFETEIKQDGSPVTIADQAIEREMRRRISARFRDHGIYGEEFGSEILHFTWVVDPIDGTKSFVTGMPLFGTLVALVEGDRAILGVIDMPALGERWVGSLEGTWLNGSRAATSGCATLDQARLYTTSPDAFSQLGWKAYQNLAEMVSLSRFGGDCYSYGLLASGFCDLIIEEGLKPYDFMALVAVVEGAGGKISDWAGRPLGLASDGRVVAASTQALHAASLAYLSDTTS